VKGRKVTIYGPDRLLYKNVTYREYQDALKDILWLVRTSGLGKFKTPVAKPPWTTSEIIEVGKKRYKERKNIWNLGKRLLGHPLYVPYIIALGNSMAKEWNTRWVGTQINPIHSKAKAVVDQCIQQKRAPFDCVETAFNKAVYPANASDFARVARLADKEISPAKQLQILRSIINVSRGIFEPYPIKKLK
jgi:hypothetical protein